VLSHGPSLPDGTDNEPGRIFTGRSVTERPQVNRDGMRTTLTRLKRELESA
jgi:hypothetical protein